MKKLITLLSLVLFTGYTAKASHLMGGEIIVSVNSSNAAHFELTLYKDNSPNTASLGNTQYLNVSGIGSVQLNLNSVDTIVSQYPTIRYVYTGSGQLYSHGTFTAYWTSCCRNAAISNSSNPSSENFHLKTEFTSFAGLQNGTPVFLNVPTVSFPLDTMWTYNPLPYDAEGDSLYWTIDTPLTNPTSYIAGYTAPAANANGPMVMNSATGLIKWWPSQVGNYAVSILVEEFRAGVKIGEIRRDMQFSVFPDTVAMQFSAPNSISNSNGNPSDIVVAGAPYSLTFELQSATSNPSLFLIAGGEPLELSSSNADFKTQSVSSNKIEGTFTWTPNTSDIRTKPYVINIRAFDGGYSYDFSVELNVSIAVGLNESLINTDNLSVYPNPSNGKFTVRLKQVSEGDALIEVMNLNGQNLHQETVDANSLLQGASFNIDAAPGTYIIRINSEEHQSKVLFVQ